MLLRPELAGGRRPRPRPVTSRRCVLENMVLVLGNMVLIFGSAAFKRLWHGSGTFPSGSTGLRLRFRVFSPVCFFITSRIPFRAPHRATWMPDLPPRRNASIEFAAVRQVLPNFPSDAAPCVSLGPRAAIWPLLPTSCVLFHASCILVHATRPLLPAMSTWTDALSAIQLLYAIPAPALPVRSPSSSSSLRS